MDQFIYRYISFETFVGMIQNKSLSFVLPELWEDPYELKPLYALLKNTKDDIDKIIFISIFQKTFCQSWTTLAESDAMWRIYSFNNRAIRIKVRKDKIALLENVDCVSVKYNDVEYIPTDDKKELIINSLCQKRAAFEHEKEVRLISRYKFSDWDDVEKHIKAILAINSHPKAISIIENLFPSLELEEQVEKICSLLNVGKSKQKTKDISFKHIPDFVDGVMIHPQAPDWYAKIVKDFCIINQVPYQGKSKLYCDFDIN